MTREIVDGSGVATFVTRTTELSGAKSEIAESPAAPERGHRFTRNAEGARPCDGRRPAETTPVTVAPETEMLVIGVAIPLR